MIRQFSTIALAAALAAPMVWADRVERAERTRAATERATTPVPITEEARALVRSQFRTGGSGLRARQFTTRAAGAADKQATDTAQAPGVTQINLFDTSREAYFVATETIPVGSMIQAFIVLPDQKQEWGLEALRVDEALSPGFSLVLPGIRTLGDFWQSGLTTYFVIVTDPNGTQSASRTDFTAKGYFRTAEDTKFMVPGINSWREFVNSDGATIVEIKGRFVLREGIRTYVVFEDIVAPQDTIQVIDSSTIQVNVSRVPNFDTTLMKSYLLTVGQDTWTDIVPYRHTPPISGF